MTAIASNYCYKRVYNDTNKASEGRDELGVAASDIYGNEYYDMNKKYIRSGLWNKHNGIVDQTPGARGNQDYRRMSYNPVPGTPSVTPPTNGNMVGDPCTNQGKIPTPVPGAPASCSIFVPNAGEYVRLKSDSKTPNPLDPHERRTYGKYDDTGKWVTENYTSNCLPIKFGLIPELVGEYNITYMDGVLIARIEGENHLIETEVNTIIYVPAGEVSS